jgi:hypothetical protein
VGVVAGQRPKLASTWGPQIVNRKTVICERAFGMAVSVSLVALFGLVLFFLLRSRSLGPGAAFVAAGFGFFLASTGAAGPITQLATAVIGALQQL